MEKRGRLLVFEGTDCSGKSTQIDLLVKKLNSEGKTVSVLDFPNYSTPTGKVIRMYLEGKFGEANSVPAKVASLFYAEDRYASKQIILDALEEYDFVILDRYVESNMGHQGGKIANKIEREEFFRWLEELEYGNFDLPKPDAVFLLYMPWNVGSILKDKRKKKSEDHPGEEDQHESNEEHMRNAENAYLHLADLFSWVKINCAPSGEIDSLRTPEDISEELYKKVKESLKYDKKEKAVLDYFFSNLGGPIFVSKNFNPEVWALMQARYSRSTEGMRESFLNLLKEDEENFNQLYEEISKTRGGIASKHATEKAIKFMEKWVLGYGHSSVAEGAVVGIALEGVSILATKVIEDNRLSSFCEKSTRYVSFNENSFFIDKDLENSEFKKDVEDLISLLFKTYIELHEPVLEHVKSVCVRDDETPEAAWERSCAARRFDAIRYTLPTCTKTSLGWTVNARQLEHGISKLLSHPLKEMNEIGEKLKTEVSKVLPSLLKYADKNDYLVKTEEEFSLAFPDKFSDTFLGEKVRMVQAPENAEDFILASILYKYENQPFEKALERVKIFGAERREELFDLYLKNKGEFDAPMRELEHSIFTFDIVMDYGAFRDLQRHRICTQTNPILTTNLGYDIPKDVVGAGVEDRYVAAMEKAKEVYEKVRVRYPLQAQYLLPLAFRKRFLISMNLRELHHLIKLRTSPMAHDSYRRIAFQIYEKLSDRYPLLTKYIVCNYSQEELGRLKSEKKIENAA